MHEVGIMEGALETAVNLMRERGGTRLTHLHMSIGSLSGVVPDALQTAFTALKTTYSAESAMLEITWIEALCRCDTCNKDFSFAVHGYLCPDCGEPAMVILQGRELELTRLEWE